MTKEFQHTSAPKHAKGPSSRGRGALIAALVLLLLALLAAGVFFVWHVMFEQNKTGGAALENTVDAPSFDDRSVTSAQLKAEEDNAKAEEARKAEEQAHDGFPTAVIAEYDGVLLHSPVHPSNLEAILFHQASFETAHVLSTQLSEADPETMLENPDYEVAEEQPEGDEWLNAKALHLWREDTPTEMDTSIDVGAEAGTQVYAPVTGTVVLVTTYELYDVCEDYEIHIQPTGRPDLDVVEIHVQDVSVKAGDVVEGGVTPIAKVRDLAAEDITDIQLAFYTTQGHGNHTHVQINNADYPEYRETRLKDAYKVE